MKDNISLIAAAAGGFMLSIAAAGIIGAAPVTSLKSQPISSTSVEQLQLKPVHPDEPAEETLNQRFSPENSQNALKQIDGSLQSFRSLTEKSQATLGKQATAEVSHTDWETQNLGFSNWVGSVEGTLKKQEYQIKKLEFELAQKQYEDKQIPKAVLDQKAATYQTAEQEFQTFWNSFKVTD